MVPTPPFWLVQRQVDIEEIDDKTIKLTAPNLPDHKLVLQDGESESIGWKAVVQRLNEEGEDNSTPIGEREIDTDDIDTAWQIAYELFRDTVIV